MTVREVVEALNTLMDHIGFGPAGLGFDTSFSRFLERHDVLTLFIVLGSFAFLLLCLLGGWESHKDHRKQTTKSLRGEASDLISIVICLMSGVWLFGLFTQAVFVGPQLAREARHTMMAQYAAACFIACGLLTFLWVVKLLLRKPDRIANRNRDIRM